MGDDVNIFLNSPYYARYFAENLPPSRHSYINIIFYGNLLSILERKFLELHPFQKLSKLTVTDT